MRRTSAYICAALIFFMLALAAFSPSTSRTAIAAQEGDKCSDCLEKIARRFNHCQAVHGEAYAHCYDQFNEDVIKCYRSVCEQ